MKNKETWDFFVDTGGTFTDCLAHSDGLGFFRTKVLSRGVLSAQVDAVLSPQKLRLESGTDWPKKFVNGKKVSFQGNQDLELTILEWYPEESILVFENTLPSEVGPETAIEVKMLWEAPILAMQKEFIRNKINAVYGYNAVHKIKITQSSPIALIDKNKGSKKVSSEKKKTNREIPTILVKAVNEIDDKNLRQALEELAINVFTKLGNSSSSER